LDDFKGRPKGYAAWRPQAKSRVLLNQVREVLRDQHAYLPLTARQVFYRLVGAYDYPKDENAYERLLEKLNRARRAGLIPFDHLRDDGASAMCPDHYAGTDDFYGYVNRLGSRYERDKLARQEVDIRVYCEAAGMMPQLARTCDPYSVPVYSCSGFDSLTAKYGLARHCVETYTYQGRSTVILHLGDLDPSGVSIYKSMKEDILAFISKDVPSVEDPEDVAFFERVALERYHINEYGLTTYPPKITKKAMNSHGARGWAERGWRTCQLEALPPDILADELVRSIEMFLDAEVLAEDRRVEEQERRQITRALPSAG
jgi:hypothetical protein